MSHSKGIINLPFLPSCVAQFVSWRFWILICSCNQLLNNLHLLSSVQKHNVNQMELVFAMLFVFTHISRNAGEHKPVREHLVLGGLSMI